MSQAKYRWLVGELEQAIRSGRFPPDGKLPSVRELMGLHGLSLTTVTTALHVLEEQGLIEPRARTGYFVNRTPAPRPPVSAMDAEPRSGFHWWPDADLFPRERLRKITASVARRHPDLAIQSPVNCNPRLLRQLARRCAEIGCFVYEDDIMICHGVTEALSVALRVASARIRTSVLLQAPVSPLYQAICERLGLTWMGLDVRQGPGQWMDGFSAAMADRDGPRIVLLAANFHSPTGELLPLAEKRDLVAMAAEAEAVLIEDDSSGDLHFEKARPLPLKAFDTGGGILHLAASTKIFAPGLQVGWIVSGPDWRDEVDAVKSISSSAVDHLPQLVLAEFLAKGSHLPHLRKLRGALEQRAADFEGRLRPALGAVSGLEGRMGGFNRYLSVAGSSFDATFEAECRERWPALFSPQAPLFRFRGEGISVNTSFLLDDERRAALPAFGKAVKESLSRHTG